MQPWEQRKPEDIWMICVIHCALIPYSFQAKRSQTQFFPEGNNI